MKKQIIAPSILSADFARLGQDVEKVLSAGADMVHMDVMDNHFVPNLTIGPLVCKALRNYGIKAPFDVHLMIKPVDRIIPEFAESGANLITFHPEASEHIDRTIELIKANNCKAGLAFNPATPLDYLKHVIHKLDLILIMAVNPGFGGQKFIPEMLPKIKETRELIQQSKRDILLAVDGGVNIETIGDIAKAGANMFIAGSAIFKASDYKKIISDLRKQLK